jgi:hypothetical protein
MFPSEILENIFSQLPLTDLLSKALVSKHWYGVISREKVNEIENEIPTKISVNFKFINSFLFGKRTIPNIDWAMMWQQNLSQRLVEQMVSIQFLIVFLDL